MGMDAEEAIGDVHTTREDMNTKKRTHLEDEETQAQRSCVTCKVTVSKWQTEGLHPGLPALWSRYLSAASRCLSMTYLKDLKNWSLKRH